MASDKLQTRVPSDCCAFGNHRLPLKLLSCGQFRIIHTNDKHSSDTLYETAIIGKCTPWQSFNVGCLGCWLAHFPYAKEPNEFNVANGPYSLASCAQPNAHTNSFVERVFVRPHVMKQCSDWSEKSLFSLICGRQVFSYPSLDNKNSKLFIVYNL